MLLVYLELIYFKRTVFVVSSTDPPYSSCVSEASSESESFPMPASKVASVGSVETVTGDEEPVNDFGGDDDFGVVVGGCCCICFKSAWA